MKANEFRIGNLVNRLGEQTIIESIGVYGDSYGIIGTPIARAITTNQIEPILLTEQWLLKLGFYYSDDDNEYLELPVFAGFKLHADSSDNFSTVTCIIANKEKVFIHIHKIQNFYYEHSDQELTIKL